MAILLSLCLSGRPWLLLLLLLLPPVQGILPTHAASVEFRTRIVHIPGLEARTQELVNALQTQKMML